MPSPKSFTLVWWADFVWPFAVDSGVALERVAGAGGGILGPFGLIFLWRIAYV